MKTARIAVSALLILAASLAFAQAPATTPTATPDAQAVFSNAYIAGGGGHSTSAYGWAAYAKQTGMQNAGFPVYSYSEVKFYRAANGQRASDYTTGLLFPFYAKRIAGLDVALAIDGNAGMSTAGANVGYTVGAKVVAKVSKPAAKAAFIFSADPTRSSVGGIHASQVSAGLAISFNGF